MNFSTKLLCVPGVILCLCVTQSADADFTDFSFWNSSGDSTMVDGVTITLAGTNIERFGTAVRDFTGVDDGEFILTFDNPITSFTGNFGRFRDFESIDEFNISPTSVDGDLVGLGDPITSVTAVGTGDFLSGSVYWTGLDTTMLEFTMANSNGAIAFESFSFTTIPEPTTSALLGMLLSGVALRRAKLH